MKGIFLLDVDTQKDFILSSGRLAVAGAERMTARLRRVFEFARRSAVTVVSPVHAHQPGDWELKLFPPHCMIGTEGLKKVDDTLLRRPLVLENKPLTVSLAESARRHQQIIVERPEWDLFSNPVMADLLRLLPSHAIVFGVPTEHSIKSATLALKQRGVKAAVVSDLVLPLEPRSGEAAVQEMRREGVEFITLDTLMSIYSG
ncbi:MAG: cysteine hydrolase family protein [Acidobacteriota bacterium]